jgi:hypothetical protein
MQRRRARRRQSSAATRAGVTAASHRSEWSDWCDRAYAAARDRTEELPPVSPFRFDVLEIRRGRRPRFVRDPTRWRTRYRRRSERRVGRCARRLAPAPDRRAVSGGDLGCPAGYPWRWRCRWRQSPFRCRWRAPPSSAKCRLLSITFDSSRRPTRLPGRLTLRRAPSWLSRAARSRYRPSGGRNRRLDDLADRTARRGIGLGARRADSSNG